MKKHHGGHRSNDRKKTTKERQRRNDTIREQEARMSHYQNVCDTWNSLAQMHNANNDALAGIAPVSALIGNPEVLAKLSEEAKKELVHASKNLLEDVKALKEAQVILTEQLNSMRPVEAVNPDDPEREMENLTLLAHGSRYQDWAMRWQMSVLPGIATCLDLINSCVPETERVAAPSTSN